MRQCTGLESVGGTQFPPEVAESVGVTRAPRVVDNDVLTLADIVRGRAAAVERPGSPWRA